MSPKRHRVIRAGRSVPLAAAVIAIGLSTVALGSAQRRATTTVSPQATGSATAKCKHGQVALAAGFAAPGYDPSSGGGPAVRFDSIFAGKRGVKTVGFNFSDTDQRQLALRRSDRRAFRSLRTMSARLSPSAHMAARRLPGALQPTAEPSR